MKNPPPPSKKPTTSRPRSAKDADLAQFRRENDGKRMTSDHGLPISHTDDSLKAGLRGPTLLEDFHLREKITRFDHERIPERVVHARGSAAHGYFQCYEPLAELSRADFLNSPSKRTPVFVRFSTVVGSRGSADTVRDVRGFAVKFYTDEGNFDLVGNNIPVFFIQDGIKFPDLVHAVKPEPHHEMPGASSAHDNFWDFASLTPETTHMLMWILSDRAIPRSYGMMEGFGVHTFRLVNAKGKARFVKFHWKPLLGVHSLAWDEAQKLAGKDADFHRRDLWEAIERGDFPEYELGIQVIEEADAGKFDFDLLDATKMVPEELVPVQRIGKMVLDRNPDNFFSETEQVAMHVGNVVPGIDFTNDPLIQARLFSYLDTQLTRLGGPNFAQIPINRPVVPVHNHQQDGFANHVVPKNRANYHPNSTGGGCPMLTGKMEGGYAHYEERLEGSKVRARSPSFADHFSQATLFWNSMSDVEKNHIVDAARFELGKVERKDIRARVLGLFANVDAEFARRVSEGIGVPVPAGAKTARKAPATKGMRTVDRSPALSQENTAKRSAKGRKVAALLAPGYDHASFTAVKEALVKAGVLVEVIAKNLGPVASADKNSVEADKSHLTAASIFYDAVFVPGGRASAEAMKSQGDVVHFLNEAYRHCKPIGALDEGIGLLGATDVPAGALTQEGKAGKPRDEQGVVTAHGDAPAFAKALINVIAQHRFWTREGLGQVPA